MLGEQLLSEECEDLAQVCREMAGGDLGAVAQDGGALERILCLLKVYLTLIGRITGSIPKKDASWEDGPALGKISSLAYTIWRKVEGLSLDAIKAEADRTLIETERGLKTEEVQTEEVSLLTCVNCQQSKEMIYGLVEGVQELCTAHNLNSIVLKFRNKILSKKYIQTEGWKTRHELRPRLGEVTDWFSMRRLGEAITTDLERVTAVTGQAGSEKKRHKKANSRKQLIQLIQSLETKLGYGPQNSTGKEIQKLNKTITCLQEEIKKCQEESADLRKQLQTCELSKEDLRSEINLLNEQSEEDKKRVSNLEEKMVDKIKEINLLMNTYEKKISENNKTIVDIKLENSSKQKIIDEQSLSLEKLKKKLEVCKHNEVKMTERITKLKKEIVSLGSNKEEVQVLHTQLKNKEKQEKKLTDRTLQLQRELKEVREGTGKSSTGISKASTQPNTPTGDTPVDLKIQKATNDHKIQLLKSKNKRLESALNKMENSRKNYKEIGQVVNIA